MVNSSPVIFFHDSIDAFVAAQNSAVSAPLTIDTSSGFTAGTATTTSNVSTGNITVGGTSLPVTHWQTKSGGARLFEIGASTAGAAERVFIATGDALSVRQIGTHQYSGDFVAKKANSPTESASVGTINMRVNFNLGTWSMFEGIASGGQPSLLTPDGVTLTVDAATGAFSTGAATFVASGEITFTASIYGRVHGSGNAVSGIWAANDDIWQGGFVAVAATPSYTRIALPGRGTGIRGAAANASNAGAISTIVGQDTSTLTAGTNAFTATYRSGNVSIASTNTPTRVFIDRSGEADLRVVGAAAANSDYTIVASGSVLSGSPTGTYNYVGVHVGKTRANNEDPQRGRFTMSAAFTTSSGTSSGTISNYSGVAAGHTLTTSASGTVNLTDGTFSVANASYTPSGGSPTAASIYGQFHGNAARAVSGLWHTNGDTPLASGGFVGNRTTDVTPYTQIELPGRENGIRGAARGQVTFGGEQQTVLLAAELQFGQFLFEANTDAQTFVSAVQQNDGTSIGRTGSNDHHHYTNYFRSTNFPNNTGGTNTFRMRSIGAEATSVIQTNVGRPPEIVVYGPRLTGTPSGTHTFYGTNSFTGSATGTNDLTSNSFTTTGTFEANFATKSIIIAFSGTANISGTGTISDDYSTFTIPSIAYSGGWAGTGSIIGQFHGNAATSLTAVSSWSLDANNDGVWGIYAASRDNLFYEEDEISSGTHSGAGAGYGWVFDGNHPDEGTKGTEHIWFIATDITDAVADAYADTSAINDIARLDTSAFTDATDVINTADKRTGSVCAGGNGQCGSEAEKTGKMYSVTAWHDKGNEASLYVLKATGEDAIMMVSGSRFYGQLPTTGTQNYTGIMVSGSDLDALDTFSATQGREQSLTMSINFAAKTFSLDSATGTGDSRTARLQGAGVFNSDTGAISSDAMNYYDTDPSATAVTSKLRGNFHGDSGEAVSGIWWNSTHGGGFVADKP